MSLRVERSTISQLWGKDKELQLGAKAQTEGLGSEPKREGPEELSVTDVTLEELERAAGHIGRALELIDRGLEFSVHEDTNRVVVKVINRETKEVIKEIPPEQILDVIARIWDMIGLLVDEKA
ncbi:MAG TPA: flagellar protein FlaG [Firmicutes bacterium]|jgi:uncharacterized FlaG/YvyC family protein|nr:flagellar protein FlaG [Bacillota bacterium]